MAENNKSGLIDMPDLDTSEACLNLYQSFYSSIKSAQDNNPDISLDVRIMNASYSLAAPIARAIGTGEPTEPQMATFVQKAGDQMSGNLDMLYGFKGGVDGLSLIQTVKVTDENDAVTDRYVELKGKLRIASTDLYLSGKAVFNYYHDSLTNKDTLRIDGGDVVDFLNAALQTNGSLSVLGGKENGFYAGTDGLWYKNYQVWHAGNSNKADVDWFMKDAAVNGALSVSGAANIGGVLTSLNGVQLGYNDKAVAIIQSEGQLDMIGDISMRKNDSLKLNGVKVISCPTDYHIQLGAIGGDLILGGDTTNNIRLWDTLTTEAGDHNLIDKFGNAEFMNTIKIGYGFGDVLMTTTSDSVLVKKKLRFDNEQGTYAEYLISGLRIGSLFDRGSSLVEHTLDLAIGKTTSIYADQSRDSETMRLTTSADFFLFQKPIEAKSFIGIDGKPTRLTETSLFFSDDVNLVALSDGIKHYGNSYFNGNLSSVRFASGFAGYGWAMRNRLDNGNVEFTVDEAVIRKKMRVYELEIQKISVVNGSLWVSDSCAGDTVTVIE